MLRAYSRLVIRCAGLHGSALACSLVAVSIALQIRSKSLLAGERDVHNGPKGWGKPNYSINADLIFVGLARNGSRGIQIRSMIACGRRYVR